MKFFALLLFLVFSISSAAIAGVTEGEAYFNKKCKACHDFGKKKVGPDLADISKRANPEWLKKWLADTEGVWAANDPITADLKKRTNGKEKPRHKNPKEMTEGDIANLTDFLMTK
ncbi:MAG: cytochrome c [Nitrospinota bacterium]|nr:cytochrome c [Nitrospinota bacterium]